VKKKYLLTVYILLQSFTSLVQAYEPDDGLKTIPTRDNPNLGCVYRNANKNAAGEGDWVIDSCDYVGAHNACYNGSQWQVAQALGTALNSGEPQDGDINEVPKTKAIDLWDADKADALCKNLFGPSYFFSVPIDKDEDIALGVAIANIIAAKKRTWIHYKSNAVIPANKNLWLGNRSEYTNWLDNNPDNKSAQGNADCVLLNRDTGYWQDESCSAEHAFACFESGDWLLSKTAGQWRDGFATCHDDYSDLAIYAVPRDSGENTEIAGVAPPAGADAGIDFNQVWLNQTDLAYEEFFISNQTRRSWWAAGQPSNRNNADCTLINSSGEWISESCDLYQAYHACYIGDTSNDVSWVLTNALTEVKGKAISSYGFGYCKRLQDNAEYRAPNSADSNLALQNMIAADSSIDHVWINFSDQTNEGSWKVEAAYQDFESSTLVADDNKDCVSYSSITNDEGNWVAGQCYGVTTKGFACTNGYEWKIALSDARLATKGDSLESDLWKGGFDNCGYAFGADYYYAAPSSADDNSRLGLALLLAEKTSVWINVNDATNEGVWVANGPSVNLAPVLNLPNNLIHKEGDTIDLTVGASDPEGEGIASYSWSIIGTRIGEDNKDPITVKPTIIAPGLTNDTTATVTVAATDLLNEVYFIDLQLQVTDSAASPSTTTNFLTLTVLPPLKAAYDFNTFTNPRLDSTGNGHELILNTGQVKITDKTGDGSDYFAKMDANDLFEIDGSITGLQVGGDESSAHPETDQYTIMYSFKMDSLPTEAWAGFMQQGNNRQPALFYNKSTNKIQFTNSTAPPGNANENSDSVESIRLGQWMTVAYVKNGSKVELYVDKAVLGAEADPSPLNQIPDKTLNLLGSSIYDSGNWAFGNVLGAPESIEGGFDDIRIYDRALTVDELETLFPDQPKGRFEFNEVTQKTAESPTPGSFITLSVEVDRIEGDDATVSVGYLLKSGSALLNTDFKLPGTDADAIAGKGYLDWSVHDRSSKTLTVQILADELREGTESFTIELEAQPNEPGITEKKIITIEIEDKTPNVYGAIEFASSVGVNEAVIEGLSGSITVERKGDDTQGAIDVWYTVKEFTALYPEHFSIPAGQGFTAAPVGDVVGQGKLTFLDGSPLAIQTQLINFSTQDIAAYDPGKIFIVTLDKITDVGSNDLNDAEHSAILGPKNSHGQVIEDVTPGRISFIQEDFGSIDEDTSSSNRTKDIVLERRDGTSGAICVDFGFSGAGINIDHNDYVFNSLSHTGLNNDVYWVDGEGGTKTIQITAIDDQAYEILETLTITWQLKTSCDYDDSDGNDPVVTPNTPNAGDHAAATLAINDQTNDIELKFGQSLYTTTEQGEPTLSVTVYATQSGSFADLGALSNKTPFSVYLNREKISADEIDHYGDLTPQQVVSFAADQTSKVINIPIVDNCEAADNLIFNMNLKNDDVSLPSTNPPASLLKVDSASTQVSIANYSAVPTVSIGYHYDGIDDAALRADWNGGTHVTSKISTGQRTPQVTQMGVKADIGHACYKTLQYTWVNSSNTTPALPVVSGISNFSLMPSISGYDKVDGSGGGSILSDLFSLPFIIRNTALTIDLEIVDPEIKDSGDNLVKYTKAQISGLGHAINMRQAFHQIDNDNNSGQCFSNEGLGSDLEDRSCNNSSSRQLAYNVATKQLVWNDSGGVRCVDGIDGEYLTTENCSTRSEQKWNIVDGTNEDGIQRFGSSNMRVCEYSFNNKPWLTTGTCIGGADNYSWTQFD